MVEQEEARRPSQLEVAVARCGASVWAPLPPQIPTEGPTAQIEELEARKRKIGDDPAAGVLRVDAAQPEIYASSESRLRELRKRQINRQTHRINTSAAQPLPPIHIHAPAAKGNTQCQTACQARKAASRLVGGFGLLECNKSPARAGSTPARRRARRSTRRTPVESSPTRQACTSAT